MWTIDNMVIRVSFERRGKRKVTADARIELRFKLDLDIAVFFAQAKKFEDSTFLCISRFWEEEKQEESRKEEKKRRDEEKIDKINLKEG